MDDYLGPLLVLVAIVALAIVLGARRRTGSGLRDGIRPAWLVVIIAAVAIAILGIGLWVDGL
jgi:hypothetical protein